MIILKILILSGSPKEKGLCRSIIEAAKEGIRCGKAQVEEVNLNDFDLLRCQVCNDGWGTCREEDYCSFGDDGFNEIQKKVGSFDAYVIVTPVYWGEMSESLKCFLDRLRRCEFGPEGILSGKQVILVASAGGTGNGILSCLEQMDRFSRHTGAIIFDYFGVNRWNADYKREALKKAVCALAEGRKNNDTI